jgi:hypothetical protein
MPRTGPSHAWERRRRIHAAHARADVARRPQRRRKKLGLLDDWLRERFHDLGILQYEDREAADEALS